MRRLNVAVRIRWGWLDAPAILWAEKARQGQPVATWTGEAPRWVQPVKRDGRACVVQLPPRKVRRYRDTPAGSDYPVTSKWLAEEGWGPEPWAWSPLCSVPSTRTPASRPPAPHSAGAEWAPEAQAMSWPDPLPRPLPRQVEAGRFVRVDRQRFDAAEAAREMEEWREAARAQGDKVDEVDRLEGRIAGQWWRDADELTYSAAGSISPREAEGRVMRALYFLGGALLEDHTAPGRLNADVLRDLAIAAQIARNEDDELVAVPRAGRTPDDTDNRLLLAMRWACELRMSPTCNGGTRFYVLHQRAKNIPPSWKTLSNALGCSRANAKQLHDDALARIHRIANTGTPLLDAAIATVQQGNRAYALNR